MMPLNLTWPEFFFYFPGATVALLSFNSTQPFLQWRGDGKCYVPKGLVEMVENMYCFNHMHGHFTNTLHHFIEYGWFSPFLSIWTNSLFKVCRDPHVLKNSAYQGADAESERATYALECLFLKEPWLSSVGVLRSCFLLSSYARALSKGAV